MRPSSNFQIEKILNDSGVISELEKGCNMEKVWNLARNVDQTSSLVDPDDASLFTLESVRQALKQCNREAMEANIAANNRICCSSTPLARKGLRIWNLKDVDVWMIKINNLFLLCKVQTIEEIYVWLL